MSARDTEWQVEDLEARRSSVMIYGIVACVLGIIALVMLFMCSMCNFVAPFAIIVGALALFRGREIIKPLADAGVDDGPAIVGIITGAVGFVMGLICLLMMVVTGVLFGFYVGCISLLIANSP